MKPCFKIDEDTFSITAHLSEDKLKLFIDVRRTDFQKDAAPEHWPLITAKQILTALQPATPHSDLHEGVIQDIVKGLLTETEILNRRVAKGTPAEKGRDGKLVLLARTLTKTVTRDTAESDPTNDEKEGKQEQTQEEREKELDSALRGLRLFENILTDQVVGRVYPPSSGTAGVDALGKEIPAQSGNALKVTLDKTLSRRSVSGKNYEEIVAKQDGLLEKDNDNLRISDHLEIPGDLDFRFGNIQFVGSVTIKGDVNTNFSVQANKDIHIKGSVQRSKVHSLSGNIQIDGFLIGPDAQAIATEGSITIAGAQEAELEAGEDIIIKKECIESKCWASGSILSPEATFMGGAFHVLCGLEAKRIGSEQGIPTVVFITSDMELSQEYRSLVLRLAQHEQAIATLELHLGPYAKKPELIEKLGSSHKAKMSSLSKKLQALVDSKRKIENKITKAKSEERRNMYPRVNFASAFYPGVDVYFDIEHFSTDEKLDGPKSMTFSEEAGGFELSKHEPIQCDLQQKMEKGVEDE